MEIYGFESRVALKKSGGWRISGRAARKSKKAENQMRDQAPSNAQMPDGAQATLGDFAFQRIREDILAGHLPPESKLRFQMLRDLYGLNVGTLREGLARLVAEGLVVAEGQKGFRVAPVSKTDLLDLTELRLRIEPLVLRLSIERGDVEWETRVLGAYHQLSRVPRSDEDGGWNLEWELKHRAFHRSLISGANSTVLIQTHSILFDRSERYRRLARLNVPRSGTVNDEHHAIMRATITRDADLACKLIEKHVTRTRDKMLRWVTSLN